MNVASHAKFWLIVSVMMFFVMTAVVKPEKYLVVVQDDIGKIYMTYGDERGAMIVGDANSWFAGVFGDTPVKKTVDHMHNTRRTEASFFGPEQLAAAKTNKLLRTLKLEMYAIFLRASSAASWLVAVLILGGAAMVDGLVSRQIKVEGYGFTSPAIQSRLVHLCMMVMGLSCMLFYLPVSVPLWWWPFVVIATTVSVRFIASNMKQVTT